jgi:hypothetical protein
VTRPITDVLCAKDGCERSQWVFVFFPVVHPQLPRKIHHEFHSDWPFQSPLSKDFGSTFKHSVKQRMNNFVFVDTHKTPSPIRQGDFEQETAMSF